MHILNGRYLDVLALPEVQEAMVCVLEKDSASCKQAEDARAAAVLENMKDMSAAALASCWCGAVAALHVFWQNNWTGPVVEAAVDIFAKLVEPKFHLTSHLTCIRTALQTGEHVLMHLVAMERYHA